MNECEVNGAVFVDLRKAFDLVDHKILLEKLNLYLGQPCVSSKLAVVPSARSCVSAPQLASVSSFFESYLSDRHQYVSVNGVSSTMGAVDRGVPQGSVLGPLLFNLFINDMPLHIEDDKVDCDLFADDATLHTPDKNIHAVNNRLQNGLNDMSEWCTKNRMAIHPTKTECMVITSWQKRQHECELDPLELKLSLQGQPIAQVSHHKLLGVIIDEDLRWQHHIDRMCKKISSNLYLLAKLRPFVDVKSRLMFYNAHIKSHFDYASTVWDGSADVHIGRLDSLNRRAAKLISDLNGSTTDQKLYQLKLLPLRKHLAFNKGMLMFKIRRNRIPKYISKFFKKQDCSYTAYRQRFIPPKTRRDFFKTSLSFSGTELWNSLPLSVVTAGSLPTFRDALHKHLLRPP